VNLTGLSSKSDKMEVKVFFFGGLAEITGEGCIRVPEVRDTDELIARLQVQYQALSQTRYRVVVNNRMIQENTSLDQQAEVALLPPFSGG